MSMFVKLAWRNLFRNRRRTVIAGTAIGIGLACLIFVDALIVGMEKNMIRSATVSFLGEGQIHAEGFRETFEVERTIHNLEAVTSRLQKDTIVTHFTPRLLAYAMISSPANMSGVSLVGIRPETEQYLSQVDEAVIEGDFLQSDNERGILIGDELADLLEVELGDRIVLTAAQAHTGDLAQEMFRVAGIYKLGISEIDKGMAFVNLQMAQQMLNLHGEAHEIALKFSRTDYGKDKSLPFWGAYSSDGNEAAGWIELLPQLEVAFELSKFSTLILGVILFAVVTLGIINTLFMSLYERMFEFGVMRAVGTRPLAMGRLILFEAGALALFSIVLGMALGFVVTSITINTGIDYAGIEYAGVTFRELLYPVLETKQFIIYPVSVFLFTVMVGLYPAWFAARMNPVEAMRKSF